MEILAATPRILHRSVADAGRKDRGRLCRTVRDPAQRVFVREPCHPGPTRGLPANANKNGATCRVTPSMRLVVAGAGFEPATFGL